jgi:4-amino-4-deoxy-L-arabinose transferase-like glycosyltransferase
MISARISALCVFVLLFLRAIMAAQLPLSADEAYYWLWSLHPAAGYFDHPPMIAWLIRAGTLLFGDTPLGVRLAGVLLSFPASWFVWRAASLILKDKDRAGLAVLFFNLTLMVSAELLAATPDMPSVVASAAFVLFPGAGATVGRWPRLAGRRDCRRSWPAFQIFHPVFGRRNAGLADRGP